MSELIEPHLIFLRAAGRSPRTIHDRRRLLIHADGVLPFGVDTPTTDELAAFLANSAWARWTRATYSRHFKGFYRWATGAGYLDRDPMKKLESPKNPASVPNPVTDRELSQALAGLNQRWQLVVILAAFAGLRVSEITRLRRNDCTEQTIRIRNGKGGKDAVIPTHPEIWARVKDLPDGLIMRNHWTGEQLPGNYLTTELRKMFDELGMPEVHLHRFRHWYGTSLLRQGADIRTVQSLMRHTSLNTTAGYLQIEDGQRRSGILALPVPESVHS